MLQYTLYHTEYKISFKDGENLYRSQFINLKTNLHHMHGSTNKQHSKRQNSFLHFIYYLYYEKLSYSFLNLKYLLHDY